MLEKGRGVYRILVGRTEGKRPPENLDVEVRKILKWILKTLNGEAWTALNWLRIGRSGGLL
jgi:hypothetical protein